MDRRRFAVVALAGVLPWVIVTWDTGWYPLFSVGFASVSPFSFTTLPTYLARVGNVPSHLSGWPLATMLYVVALVTAAMDEADAYVVAGFLGLAAFNVGLLALSVSDQQGILAVPLGVVWLLVAGAWVVYEEWPTESHR
ncbi:TIGR04206 family protein [Halobacterium zhouii]|uniref:TIGR04206 family protein n=1 Tax=Halobacterium zhouii TaxID=2902624 RepID=UPI001E3C53AB|nr:TIGR04206 family protein [Halobacterium zhouii]